MQKLRFVFVFVFCAAAIAACNKGGNNYSTTDHTVGMIKTWSWSGYAYGYVQGDTIRRPSPDTTHIPWPKAFSRTLSDTMFPIVKVNGFLVSALGQLYNYATTDSTASVPYVMFDTLLSGASVSILTYYYAADSMTLEYHQVSGYNDSANQYYQVNEYLHTIRSM